MIKKYVTAESSAIITNDLFLASFLHCAGCTLDRVERNERRRVSFVFSGDRVRELREAYRTGPVRIDMRDFRESLNTLRDMLDQAVASGLPEERSAPHGSTRLSTRAPARSTNAQQPRHFSSVANA